MLRSWGRPPEQSLKKKEKTDDEDQSEKKFFKIKNKSVKIKTGNNDLTTGSENLTREKRKTFSCWKAGIERKKSSVFTSSLKTEFKAGEYRNERTCRCYWCCFSLVPFRIPGNGSSMMSGSSEQKASFKYKGKSWLRWIPIKKIYMGKYYGNVTVQSCISFLSLVYVLRAQPLWFLLSLTTPTAGWYSISLLPWWLRYPFGVSIAFTIRWPSSVRKTVGSCAMVFHKLRIIIFLPCFLYACRI